MISSSRLATDRSVGETATDGKDIERFGRECPGDCEIELLVPWLDVEALRDLAEDSSCESDTDCESDLTAVSLESTFIHELTTNLEWSDSDEAPLR